MVWQTRITRGDGRLRARVTQTHLVLERSKWRPGFWQVLPRALFSGRTDTISIGFAKSLGARSALMRNASPKSAMPLVNAANTTISKGLIKHAFLC